MPDHPSFEPLEPRLLLSGNVTVAVAYGNLTITGDDLNNDIVLTNGSGQNTIKISSGPNATTINNAAGPTTFSGVTGDVNVALNGGDDRVSFTSVNLPRDLTVNGGAGNNTILFSVFVTVTRNFSITNGAGDDTVTLANFSVNGTTSIDNGAGNNTTNFSGAGLSGNVTIMGGSGADTVDIDGINPWNGGLTVISGTGASDVEVTNSFMTGGISVFAYGGGTIAAGPYAGYASVVRVANACDIGGAVNVFNGPGPNTVGLNASALHSGVLISNGPGAAYAGLSNAQITGAFTFLRGDGGALVGTLSAYASQVNMDHTTVTGGVTIINGAGVDESSFTSDTLGGAVLISNGDGPSQATLDGTTVAGGFTLMTSGGGSLPAPNGPLTTLTTFKNAPEIGGDLDLFLGAGVDEQDFTGLIVHGSVLINNGPDNAFAEGSNCTFQHSFTWLRGDGVAGELDFGTSTLGPLTVITGSGGLALTFSTCTVGGIFTSNGGASLLVALATTVNGSVTHIATGGSNLSGPWADYATYTQFGVTSHVTGDITVLAGAGNDDVDIENTNVDGSVFFWGGSGGALLTTDSEIIKGRLTFLRGDGGNLAAEPGYASYVLMSNTILQSDMTFMNGAGDDGLNMTNVGGQGLLVLDGPDAASVSATDLVLAGSLTMIRGDGGSLPFASGYASYEQYSGGTEVHGAFIMNGAGKDLVSLDSVNFHGTTTILNGTGDQVVGVASSTTATDMGSLSISGAGGVAQISIGDVSGVYTDVGDLSITTGDSNDTITLRRFGLLGNTSINTGGGDDTVAIDDGTFIGTVDITTGPAYVATGTDNDTVNIERVAGTTDHVTFGQMLRINGGAGDDIVRIGLHGDANAYAHFFKGFQIDGGSGANTLDYWTGGNVFEAGAVQDHPNFAVVE